MCKLIYSFEYLLLLIKKEKSQKHLFNKEREVMISQKFPETLKEK